jgi:hypothetical protein
MSPASLSSLQRNTRLRKLPVTRQVKITPHFVEIFLNVFLTLAILELFNRSHDISKVMFLAKARIVLCTPVLQFAKIAAKAHLVLPRVRAVVCEIAGRVVGGADDILP